MGRPLNHLMHAEGKLFTTDSMKDWSRHDDLKEHIINKLIEKGLCAPEDTKYMREYLTKVFKGFGRTCGARAGAATLVRGTPSARCGARTGRIHSGALSSPRVVPRLRRAELHFCCWAIADHQGVRRGEEAA